MQVQDENGEWREVAGLTNVHPGPASVAEQQMAQFAAMLGSENAARDAMRNLTELARKSGATLEESARHIRTVLAQMRGPRLRSALKLNPGPITTRPMSAALAAHRRHRTVRRRMARTSRRNNR